MNILVLPNRMVLGNRNYAKKFTYETSHIVQFSKCTDAYKI